MVIRSAEKGLCDWVLDAREITFLCGRGTQYSSQASREQLS
ncbi:hypothetical protein [Rubritalea tangerina]